MLDYDNALYWFLAVNNEIFDGYTSGGSREMELKILESITGHLKVSKNLGFHHTVPFLGIPAAPYLRVSSLHRTGLSRAKCSVPSRPLSGLPLSVVSKATDSFFSLLALTSVSTNTSPQTPSEPSSSSSMRLSGIDQSILYLSCKRHAELKPFKLLLSS